MSFDKSVFGSFASSTITVTPLSTRNAYGAPVWGTGVSYPARVTEINKVVSAPDAQEVTLTHRIWILSTKSAQSNITSEYQVTLAGSTNKRSIHAVTRPPDQSGLHHTVLDLRA